MDQPRQSSRPRQGPNVRDISDRNAERRAAVAQMMAENREGLGIKVIAVMVRRYGVLPEEMWDLNSISDMGAGRGMTQYNHTVKARFNNIIKNTRLTIVRLTLYNNVAVELPVTLRSLKILTKSYDFPLDLPSGLLELDLACNYEKPLILPANLRRLYFYNIGDQSITLPLGLVELRLGPTYKRPLTLAPRLERLYFDESSSYNSPIAFPPTLVCVRFGKWYNQPTVLPPAIEELGIRRKFTKDLSFPSSLRKIMWCCNRPIQIPRTVTEVEFNNPFDQAVVLPSTLKKARFCGDGFSRPVYLLASLEEFEWSSHTAGGLVLPAGLQKLTWTSPRSITLPLGLRELVLRKKTDRPLLLPEGLVKVTLSRSAGHYTLPASVQEVNGACDSFTHPTTLQHLIMKCSFGMDDLSVHKIHKLTINSLSIRIIQWPQELKEVEFTVKASKDSMEFPMRVPRGCRIVGGKRVRNVTVE